MDNKIFKKPDLNAKRFRPNIYHIMNDKFFERFIEKFPQYKDVSVTQLRKICSEFHNLFWQTVIDTRTGVELPEGLGYIFIGTCPTSKKENIDFAKSYKYGIRVTNKNWETDGKLAKIFYTNYSTKYLFANRDCWAFTACRKFKRSVAKTYPENWTMYVQIDPIKKVRNLFDKNRKREYSIKVQKEKLKNYNEFDL
jgi:hypothetical protein